MIKKTFAEETKYFVEDTYEEENNRVFDSLDEIKVYLQEVANDNDDFKDYLDENINIYELKNAVSMKAKMEIKLENK